MSKNHRRINKKNRKVSLVTVILSETRTPECQCPHCGITISAATPIQGGLAVPKENDITICVECGTILFYKRDLTVREAQFSELQSFRASHPETWQEIITRVHVIKRRNMSKTASLN